MVNCQPCGRCRVRRANETMVTVTVKRPSRSMARWRATRVASIVRKERLKDDDEVQTLEDVICIVFVKYELAAFAGKYADDDTRLADILAKTWRKMSERGHHAVLSIPPALNVVLLLNKGLDRLKSI